MTTTNATRNFMKAMLTPNGQGRPSKKAWSIDVENTWVPFFTAAKATVDEYGNPACDLPDDVLGAPVRLATDKDGNVRFGANGRPITRVHSDLNDQIAIVRENFIASLHDQTGAVMEENPEGYATVVANAQAAAAPIYAKEADDLSAAEQQRLIAEAARQAAEEAALALLAQNDANSDAQAELNAEAEAEDTAERQAEADAHAEASGVSPVEVPKGRRRQPAAA